MTDIMDQVDFVEDVGAVDWNNAEDTALPGAEQIMRPFGWKVLVMPLRPVTKVGSIIMPYTRQEADEYLNYVGRVVALGPLCYKHSKYADMGMRSVDQPKRGDWVIYPVNQYQRLSWKGVVGKKPRGKKKVVAVEIKLVMMNDDSFLGIIPKGVDPWAFKLQR